MPTSFASCARLVASAALVLVAACGGSSGATLGVNPTNALPPIKVDLPPPPPFTPPDVPIKSADGTYSIYGVRKDKANTLGKDVKVQGFLLELYQCPPCPKKQTCKACNQPHFIIGDKADTKKEKALMVVDYLGPKQKPPVLTVGKQYVIQGSFSINSPTGFADSNGLLVFGEMHDDKNVDFVAPAKKLEEKALNGEAIEAAMAAKREAAKKNKK